MTVHTMAGRGLIAVAAAVALAGCSGEDATPSSSSSPVQESNSTHSTEAPSTAASADNCGRSQLAGAAAGAARTLGKDNVYTIDSVQCADGWAVTSGVLSSTQNPDMGAPTSFVFRRVGQVWVGQDKAKVCGTSPTTTVAPADAAIPAALFLSGCAAG